MQTGFPLGFTTKEQGKEGNVPNVNRKRHYLNNHLVFNVLVHKLELNAEQLEAYDTFEQQHRNGGEEGGSGTGEKPASVEPPHGWMIVG